MYFLVLIICLFIFLFSIYVLGKDDYLFIRKNFSLEHLFDYVFIGLFAGVIFARFLWVFFRSKIEKNFLPHLFSPIDAGITLAAIVIGSMLILYLISKYRKLPTWRLCDFFSLAFLSSFSFGYLASSLFVKKSEIFYYLIPAMCYLGICVFFWKVLYLRLISGKLRDGSLSSLFLQVFSLISLVLLFVYQFLNSSLLIDAAYIFLFIIFWGSFIFLLRNEKHFKKVKYK
jgi:hypothetical protein